MAIKIPSLDIGSSSFSKESNDVHFVDLHLDFEKTGTYNTLLQRRNHTNDIKVDFDSDAIKNSLANLLTTRPGQRYLFPEYGIILNSFLFEPVSDESAQLLGETIVAAIRKFEKRINVIQCKVIPNEEEHEYDISILFDIPLFKANSTINTILDIKSETFTFA